MKSKYTTGLLGLILAGSASAQGLYYTGDDAQESIPLKWVVGASLVYDDNVSPGVGTKEDSFGISPYVGLSFVNITPQTTVDVYARLGLVYYFDAPDYMDDVNSDSRLGFNLTHRFNERLRFSSRNFIAYELEPDYSYGYASSRQNGEYFYWQTDNSIGYRWSERLATYTGFKLTGSDYDGDVNDRFTWELYNQFRYQLSPQTVLTFDYRYAETTDPNSDDFFDTTDQYILIGAEQRFSPNTIGIIRGGLQIHDVNDAGTNYSPYLELAVNSQVNQQFSVRGFARYGLENYDNVRFVPLGLAQFDERETLRLGVSTEYAVTPVFSIFSGVDYIPAQFNEGRLVSNGVTVPGAVGDFSEDVFNTYVGVSMKVTDYLTATAAYNFTYQDSDFPGQTYHRNRISVGLSAEF
ncbi:MAG: hypothetical protein V4640_13385 [Verrucomicrobiota bacterium]